MTRLRRSATPCRTSGALTAGLLAALVLSLALAAPALARSGRVGPESHGSPQAPGKAADVAAGGGYVQHGIWDAQPTGTLVYTRTEVAPEMTLTATDANGATAWSVATGDVWAATAKLPAAFIAVYADPDPNVLRSGELRAYNADGSVRFHEAFTKAFVQPLCDTPRRLVWVEVSANRVSRLFVRQGSRTRSVALPYRPPKASFPNPAASSANGSRAAVGVYMQKTDRWRTMMYWLRVSRAGVPDIVSRGVTDWPYLAISPDGTKAAVMRSRNAPVASDNRWVDFGKFTGRLLPGEGSSEIAVGPHRIFEQGGYSYQSDSTAWGTATVAVVDWSMQYAYERAWAWDNATGSIWFRHDARVGYLAGVDNTGALTAINVENYATATVPGIYADVVPLSDGRLATLTPAGLLSFIPNPVPGP